MIGASASINLNVAGLNNLTTVLDQAGNAYLKVGVLGDYAGRTPDQSGTGRQSGTKTNPEIGFDHEFGNVSRHLPELSFLRMPIMLKLPDALQEIGTPERWTANIMHLGIIGILDLIGNKCIQIIAAAFASGGFGNWQQLSIRTIMEKGSDEILIHTGQLQRSVTYAVVARGAPEVSLSPLN